MAKHVMAVVMLVVGVALCAGCSSSKKNPFGLPLSKKDQKALNKNMNAITKTFTSTLGSLLGSPPATKTGAKGTAASGAQSGLLKALVGQAAH